MKKTIQDGKEVWVEGAIERENLLYRVSYLVLPRVLLDEMPLEWQEQFMALMKEMESAWKWYDIRNEYMVKLRENGKFIKDPLGNYRHPDQAYIDSVRRKDEPGGEADKMRYKIMTQAERDKRQGVEPEEGYLPPVDEKRGLDFYRQIGRDAPDATPKLVGQIFGEDVYMLPVAFDKLTEMGLFDQRKTLADYSGNPEIAELIATERQQAREGLGIEIIAEYKSEGQLQGHDLSYAIGTVDILAKVPEKK